MRTSNIAAFVIITTAALAAAVPACAQRTVAPTESTVGSPRGEDAGDYNVVNSFELGYRFRTVDGSTQLYRSQVNFGNGLRLLSSSLTVNSREGHGKWFDDLSLTTSGLGNDPYQMATFRIAKNRLYRYDMTWRLNAYYNPAASIAFGTHLVDTTHILQDHNVTLFPQGNFRILTGYSRSAQNGPAYSSVLQFDSRGQAFPLFSNVRRSQDEYRLGAEARVAGFKLIALHSWEFFKEDTAENLSGGPTYLAPSSGPVTTLNTFTRTDPYHGSTPGWRVALFREQGSVFAVNGRFTYAGGRRNFIFDEDAAGARSAVNRTHTVLAYGNARRPALASNLNLSFTPVSRLTITNQTAFNDTRIDGDAFYQELTNGVNLGDLVHFQYLGIRTVVNDTDLNFRPARAVTLFAGYHYATRHIKSIEQITSFGQPDRTTAEQDNTLQVGVAGVRLKPVKPLTLIAEGEIGRADHPIYPTSERNYQAIAGRAQYRLGPVTASGVVKTNYNANATSLTAYSSRSRNYSADIAWSRGPIGFDAGYTKLHLDTLGGMAYFASGNIVTGEDSLYISNVHTVQFTTRATVRKVDLFAGLSRVQDTGDGRATAQAAVASASANSAFRAAQTFPLTFVAPMARVSIPLRNKLRWNLGYQYYGYAQDFPFLWAPPCASGSAGCALPPWMDVRNYHAHTGYTSLLWTF
jgi:hypothetical protein